MSDNDEPMSIDEDENSISSESNDEDDDEREMVYINNIWHVKIRIINKNFYLGPYC